MGREGNIDGAITKDISNKNASSKKHCALLNSNGINCNYQMDKPVSLCVAKTMRGPKCRTSGGRINSLTIQVFNPIKGNSHTYEDKQTRR